MGNNSHVKKIESAQSIILRTIINRGYIRNEELRKDLGISTVKEEIERYCGKYKISADNHPNELANDLHKISTQGDCIKRIQSTY